MSPDDRSAAEHWFEQGRTAYYNHNIWDASFAASRAIQIKPDFADAYILRGMTYCVPGNLARALQDFRTAARLQGDKVNLWLAQQIADIEAKGGKDNITAPGFFRKLAVLMYNDGNYQQAAIEFTYWLEQRPSAIGYANRAGCYVLLGRFEEAVADCTKALELNKSHLDAYCNRGLAYRELKQYPQAITDFNRALELNPSDRVCLFNRGQTYRLMGDYPAAIAALKPLLASGFDHAHIHLELSLAYSALGHRQAAEQHRRTYEQMQASSQTPVTRQSAILINPGPKVILTVE